MVEKRTLWCGDAEICFQSEGILNSSFKLKGSGSYFLQYELGSARDDQRLTVYDHRTKVVEEFSDVLSQGVMDMSRSKAIAAVRRLIDGPASVFSRTENPTRAADVFLNLYDCRFPARRARSLVSFYPNAVLCSNHLYLSDKEEGRIIRTNYGLCVITGPSFRRIIEITDLRNEVEPSFVYLAEREIHRGHWVDGARIEEFQETGTVRNT